jgi:hypothetical protein
MGRRTDCASRGQVVRNVHNQNGGSSERVAAPYGVQQKDVAPVGLASPWGWPPPGVTAHVPAVVSVGDAASLTGSGAVKAAHALGASREPPPAIQPTVMAGEAMVHCAPVGAPQAHAEQPRSSSTEA